mgnify:CR=1 FL=1
MFHRKNVLQRAEVDDDDVIDQDQTFVLDLAKDFLPQKARISRLRDSV